MAVQGTKLTGETGEGAGCRRRNGWTGASMLTVFNALADQEIRERLGSIGYTEERLRRGIALIEDANDRILQRERLRNERASRRDAPAGDGAAGPGMPGSPAAGRVAGKPVAFRAIPRTRDRKVAAANRWVTNLRIAAKLVFAGEPDKLKILGIIG